MYGNLRIFRESLGMTQKEFASSIAIGLTTYNGYETGARDPKSDFWIAVAQKYNVTVDYLMGYSNDPHKTSEGNEKSPPYSSEAMKLAADYDGMDQYGKEMVRVVADKELERIRMEAVVKAAPLEEEKSHPKFRVPGYLLPMSAGTGQEAGQEFSEDYTLVKAPPRGTSYIACVSGKSMEPTYHDGDLVFVHACVEIPVGKIGVFLMNGQQYIKERGEHALISHNSDQETYHPLPFTEGMRCQGLVLGVCDDSYLE